MPLYIVRDDITKVKTDAIVNAANESLLGGCGVDGAIHRAAGKGLLEECRKLGGCQVGHAKMTKGYKLPARYVIHTVGPRWFDGKNNEEGFLRNCYQSSLKLAQEHNLTSIAFPLISSGVFGYPKEEALKVATSEIRAFLKEHDMVVKIIIYDRESFEVSSKLFKSVKTYIDEHYIAKNTFHTSRALENRSVYKQDKEVDTDRLLKALIDKRKHKNKQTAPDNPPSQKGIYYPDTAESTGDLYEMETSFKVQETREPDFLEYGEALKKKRSLEDLVNSLEETFSQMLLRLIDEKGMTDSQAYKKANVDRRLFSKIRKDSNYKPGKRTVIAFSIALELNLDETRDLLKTAGFALSRSSRFDVIIEYFISEENYDVFLINEVLFKFEEKLLGA